VMWGPKRGAVLLPPAPLDGTPVLEALAMAIDAPGLLVVGEGLESTLSLMARAGAGVRLGAATLDLGNLEGGALVDGPNDSLPLHNLRGDPARAPFTIADAGAVLVGVDADMKPLRQRWVQERPRKAAIRRDVTGAERADICGALAASHWTQAGADSVAVARPPAGADFNDLDRRAA